MKKIISLLFAGLVGFSTFAAPTVTDVVAKQRYPWNGLVDITCKVSGIDETIADRQFVLSAVFPDSENAVKMSKVWVMRDGVKSGNLAADTNGNYRLLWDAKADLGEARYTNMIVRVIIKERLMVQLWHGGPYWATTNIGAEKPEDCGYHFWWGDTVGYKKENDKLVASDGSNFNFLFGVSNTPTFNKSISTLRNEGWIVSNDGIYVLAPEHDAAQKHWGGNWRLPNRKEFVDLNSKCDWIWTTTNGVNGYVVRGKGDYSTNRIFLPATGFARDSLIYNPNCFGYYWASDPYPDSDFYSTGELYFDDSYNHYVCGEYRRDYGQAIRPLLILTK